MPPQSNFEYKLPNNKILKINRKVIDIFYKHRQARSISESGGVLLGKLFGELLVIEQASVPGKGDKRGLFFFHRNKKRAQTIVDMAYQESNGGLIYIGEWHTHNENNPKPSWVDRLEIKRAFKKSKLNLDFIICIIVGNDIMLGNLWVGYYDGYKIIPCQSIISSADGGGGSPQPV